MPDDLRWLPLVLVPLALGCGPTEPSDGPVLNGEFSLVRTGDRCAFVFRATAEPPGSSAVFEWHLRGMSLISPTVWAAIIPLEDSSGTFVDSLRVGWEVPLGGKSTIGRELSYRLASGAAEHADTTPLLCGG